MIGCGESTRLPDPDAEEPCDDVCFFEDDVADEAPLLPGGEGELPYRSRCDDPLVCADGFTCREGRPFGVECVPEDPGTSRPIRVDIPWDLRVPRPPGEGTVPVRFGLTRNGAAAPPDAEGLLRLERIGPLPATLFAAFPPGSVPARLDAALPPGRYRVHWAVWLGDEGEWEAMPLTGELAVAAPGEVVLDQRVVRLTVDLRFDGVPAPPNSLAPGAYWVARDGRGETTLAEGSTLAVAPGPLWLQLFSRSSGRSVDDPPSDWPVGRSAPVELAVGSEPPAQSIAVDLPIRRLPIRVTVDGLAPAGTGREWVVYGRPNFGHALPEDGLLEARWLDAVDEAFLRLPLGQGDIPIPLDGGPDEERRIALETSTLRVQVLVDGEPAPPWLGVASVSSRPPLVVTDDDEDGAWSLPGFRGRCVEVLVVDGRGDAFLGSYELPEPLCFPDAAAGEVVVDVPTVEQTIVVTDRLASEVAQERWLQLRRPGGAPARHPISPARHPLPSGPRVEVTVPIAVGRHDIDLVYEWRGRLVGPWGGVERFPDIGVPSTPGTLVLAANEKDLVLRLTHGGLPLGVPAPGTHHGQVFVQTGLNGTFGYVVTGDVLATPVASQGLRGVTYSCDSMYWDPLETPCRLEGVRGIIWSLLEKTRLP